MNNLIIFGEDWGSHPSSTQHLAKHLQESNNITWINSIGMRAPRVNWRDLRRVATKLIALVTRKVNTKIGPDSSRNFKVKNLFSLPWHNQKWVNVWNKRQVKNALGERHENDRRTYWLSLPTALSMVDVKPQDRVIYYCGDDFYALDGVDASMIAKWEPQLIARADVILVASETLKEKMPKSKTHLLEHGVDLDLFCTPKPAHPSISPNKKTIGFYGSISSWVNISLMSKLAESCPQAEILLVGAVKTDVSPLRKYENVKILEPVDHEILPQFSQHWDVLLMPFEDNEQIRACNPLKLKEYLAVGRPIVSTIFPSAEKYQSWVHLASCDEEFTTLVLKLLDDPKQCKKNNEKPSFLHDFDWSSKAKIAQKYL